MSRAPEGIDDLVTCTPLVRAQALDQLLGPPSLRLKLENRQRTGSFKLRGAVRKLAALAPDARARGVVAASAGNHGQGVALAGTRLGIAVTVFVPATVPEIKRALIRELGAHLVVEGALYDDAEAAARAHAAATGAVFVSPFDDELVIEGNGGTLADELLSQAPDLSMVVCPVGGGGLIGGLGRRLAPRGVRVVGVQPAANCAMHESLTQNRALVRYHGQPTLAEGCEGGVAERTYGLAREYVSEIVLVSEAAIRHAVAFAHRRLGQRLEPSGAVALAAFLQREIACAAAGATVCVLTGANIEPALLDEILAEHDIG
jgi:threonine dehydratase